MRSLLKSPLNPVLLTIVSCICRFFLFSFEEQKEIVNDLTSEVEGLRIEYDALFNKGNLTDGEQRKLEILERQLEVQKELLAVENKRLAEK